MVNYPIISSFPTLTTLFPYLRFKVCLDCLMVLSLVYRGTRSWSWWHHQGLWCHYYDVRARDPKCDPFSHHNLWTHTRTLHTNLHTLRTNLALCDTPPTKVSPVLRAEEVDVIFLTHLWNVLEYALIMLRNKPYLRMYFSYSGGVTWFWYGGPFFRKSF